MTPEGRAIGEHTDHTTDIRSRVDIAVSDRSQCGCRPIEGVKEIMELNGFFQVEHHQCGYHNIENSHQKDGEEDMAFFMQHAQEHEHVLGVAQELENTHYLDQTRETEEFEHSVEERERGEDRQ